jgi:acyl-CoA hydrolase
VPLVESVTSFQHSCVISEQGEAQLFGRTADEQASGLIEQVAHPSARPLLRVAAGQLSVQAAGFAVA